MLLLLKVDAEMIIVKLFKFLHIYTVQFTELNTFCEFVSVEYKQILSYLFIHAWLRLLPALEQVKDGTTQVLLCIIEKSPCNT